MKDYDELVVVDGERYFTVSQFARTIKKSEQTIFSLISKGNRIRKLSARKLAGRPLIPLSELTAFPFTLPGAILEIYHYDEEGNQLSSYRPEERE